MLLGISIRAGATTLLSALQTQRGTAVSEVLAKEFSSAATPQYGVPRSAVGRTRRGCSARALVGMGSAVATVSTSQPLGAIRCLYVESALSG